MTTVSVREFSYNPSAMFARAERGETIEVTRHGKVIATGFRRDDIVIYLPVASPGMQS